MAGTDLGWAIMRDPLVSAQASGHACQMSMGPSPSPIHASGAFRLQWRASESRPPRGRPHRPSVSRLGGQPPLPPASAPALTAAPHRHPVQPLALALQTRTAAKVAARVTGSVTMPAMSATIATTGATAGAMPEMCAAAWVTMKPVGTASAGRTRVPLTGMHMTEGSHASLRASAAPGAWTMRTESAAIGKRRPHERQSSMPPALQGQAALLQHAFACSGGCA